MLLLNKAKSIGAALLLSLGAFGLQAHLIPSVARADQTVLMVRERGVYNLPLQFNRSLNVMAIIDTGASTVGIPREVADALADNGTLTRGDLLPPVRIGLADGRHYNAPRIRIRYLRIDQYELRNVIAVVNPSGSPVLLGQGVLQRFGRYTLDTDHGLLILPD